MLIGLIRPMESREVPVDGESLADVRVQLERQIPHGWELVATTVDMRAGSTALKAVGRFERRDGLREVEGDTIDAVRAAMPEGWALLHVRRV
ncbi:hypothetical protein [Microbacterium album]|uniref:Uncharacterized protein n=1 Tax=Microbacterium album TaxID=2053191 RepID=A0A917IBA6_9MICO|nr:hypothetical protein [Microbacterium album]GGH34321.1 hypothetical protein GCM10010921_01940 [Microbacterium album]